MAQVTGHLAEIYFTLCCELSKKGDMEEYVERGGISSKQPKRPIPISSSLRMQANQHALAGFLRKKPLFLR